MNEALREHDIRPPSLFDEYQRLVRDDIEVFFSAGKHHETRCESCDAVGDFAFTKDGFSYKECVPCGNLWMSPRPSSVEYETYYRDSPSSHYWSDVFSPSVESERLTRLWRPKAQKIQQIMSHLSVKPDYVIDVGGGTGLFAEAYRDIDSASLTVIEPNPKSAIQCRRKNLEVLEKFLEDVMPEDLPSGRKVFTSFELFEHVLAPRSWLGNMRSLMQPGDLLLLTTLNAQGLDIQVLWERSRAIFPPIHINFMNPTSLSSLGRETGLTPLLSLTPGQLDLDILLNEKEQLKDRFWSTFIATATDDQREEWQALIAASGFSSHMWIVFEAV